MYRLDKTRVREVLLAQDLKPHQVDRLLNHFPPLPDWFGSFVEQWLEEQNIPDLEVDGITVKQVMDNHHAHFLVAIRDLAVLMDPDLPAEKRAQWKRILSTPRMYE